MVVGVVAALVVLLDGDDRKGTRAVSTPGSVTSTTGPSDDVVVTIICITPREAAENLVESWRGGSRAAAGRCATSAAVSQLFEAGGGGDGGDDDGATWTFQGCQDGPAPVTCSYSHHGGTATLTVTGSEDAGFVVEELVLVSG